MMYGDVEVMCEWYMCVVNDVWEVHALTHMHAACLDTPKCACGFMQTSTVHASVHTSCLR